MFRECHAGAPSVPGGSYFYYSERTCIIVESEFTQMTATLPRQDYELNTTMAGFVLERIEALPELQTTGYQFRHVKSGAHCIHLFNNDPDNLFSIAFRTPVYDSTGVPHILEHSVLCGSRRYPVKDPFQEMLKGSLQTFLNALTYPDKTVYPVSSQVEKDYYNLASIYADAVFNPLLSESTFYQEGWHFDVEDTTKPVGIKGIVYNEMKGVFSNFSSHVDRRTLSALFPDTTYHFESGGDPEHITDLTYEQFIAFHRRYYHPSNSYIVLYGNIPSEKTLRFLDEQFLAPFDAIDVDVEVLLQKPWDAPRSHSFEAPAPAEDAGTATVILAWIFGETVNALDTLTGKVLSYYLLDTESSPLKRALIDSGLGEDLADFCGFDSELRQSVFAAGLRKTKPEHAEAVEKLVLDTLHAIVKNGPDFELLEGALRQIEFGLREVTGGHFPYNLRMAERCYRSWMYGGDPFAHCAFEKTLSVLKNECERRTSYFSNVIRGRLLDNTHRLRCTVVASPDMGARLEKQTEKQAARLSASFTAGDVTRYAELTKTLLAQQMAPPSAEGLAKLPRLDIADLPRRGFTVETVPAHIGGSPADLHRQFTSGIVYIDIGFDLAALPTELLPFVPLYCEYATRCGAAGFTYEQMATRIARASGGIDASVSCKTVAATDDNTFVNLFFHAKALLPRFGETCALLRDLLVSPEAANEKLLRDILLEERNGLHAAIIGSGHRFALTHAGATLSTARAIDEIMGGISQLRFLETLVQRKDYTAVADALKEIHRLVISRAAMRLIITADEPQEVIASVDALVAALPSGSMMPAVKMHTAPESDMPVGIEINSAVNFVGEVWKMPPVEPQTAGLLLLLSRILSAGYLWDKVRVEGGAYGGMSTVSVAHPLFSCASYRDPNLVSTVHHFTAGLQMIADGLPREVISQNIIGTIGHIDSPLPPHGRSYNESILLWVGVSEDFRQRMRDAVFAATPESLSQLAVSILQQERQATTVLGSSAALDNAEKQGFSCRREPLINGK